MRCQQPADYEPDDWRSSVADALEEITHFPADACIWDQLEFEASIARLHQGETPK